MVCCAQAMDGPSKEAAAANANTNVLVMSFLALFRPRGRSRRGRAAVARLARKTPAAGRACTSNSTTMKAYEK
jgi:hypothetical protein